MGFLKKFLITIFYFQIATYPVLPLVCSYSGKYLILPSNIKKSLVVNILQAEIQLMMIFRKSPWSLQQIKHEDFSWPEFWNSV